MANEKWRERLAAAIAEKKGASKRGVSLSAGLGAGAVHSWLSEEKIPSIENLMAVCAVLEVSVTRILYGYDITPQTEEILSLLEGNPSARDGILQLLRAKQGD